MNKSKSTQDLKSSISSTYFFDTKTVTQIIHFVGGIKRTFTGLIPDTIKQGQYTKIMTLDGRLIVINDDNVLCIEVFPETED